MSERDARHRFLREIECVEAPAPILPGRIEPTGDGAGGQGRQREAETQPLSDLGVRLLTLLAVRVPPPLTKLFERAGVARREGGRAVGALAEAGLVRQHSVPRGRGGPLKLLEVTETGARELKRRGIEPPERPTQGDWLHRVTAAALAERAARRGAERLEFEVVIEDRRCDARWWDSDGRIVIAEIGLSSVERETDHAIATLQSLADQRPRFLMICRDTAFKNKFLSRLKTKAPAGVDLTAVETRLAGQLIARCHE